MTRLLNCSAACLIALATFALGGSSLRAQSAAERYDLGVRVKRMERAWDSQQDPSIRATAAVEVKTAVSRFFALRFAEASRQLDVATLQLFGASDDAAYAWLTALRIDVPLRLLDANDQQSPTVAIRLRYGSSQGPPDGAIARISLRTPAGETVGGPVEIPAAEIDAAMREPLPGPNSIAPTKLGEFRAKLEWSSAAPATVDAQIVIELCDARGDLATTYGPDVAQLPRLRDRLAAARRVQSELSHVTCPTRAASIGRCLRTLEELLAGRPQEIDVPANAMLADVERWLVDEGARATPRSTFQSGQHWGVLVNGRSRMKIRLELPPDANPSIDGPRPIVFALHGAGGSDNMFFETYGAGKIRDLCRANGWVLVATENGFLGPGMSLDEAIEAVDATIPIDRQRVFLVGHSMGSAHSVQWSVRARNKPLAVANLGGGGILLDPEHVAGTSFFVAAGEQDFGKSMATKLHARLESAGPAIPRLEWKEYPVVEHLLVVTEALPDVFAFFEERAASVSR